MRRYFAVLALAVLVPLGLSSVYHSPPLANLFGDFNHVSRLNDLFWWLIEETVLPNWHQRYFRYDVVILVVRGPVAIVFARNWRRGLLWSLAMAIILAPVLHAWYVTWILPVRDVAARVRLAFSFGHDFRLLSFFQRTPVRPSLARWAVDARNDFASRSLHCRHARDAEDAGQRELNPFCRAQSKSKSPRHS